ncbi:ribonuclease Z [Anaerobacillus alkaliphilus]|uniref:Ribonuclease Z n=1 Tax=Anaerobacillus alkaliphilus TaxID=1548597 RepID=A0A4Q0VYI4_9BACI|nr:ribonuclease Z [Anaerobacillus alkaliphilus]RXJ04619.1 ribonuclease Z [Anaerobacillus alkaliphilus]
MKLQFLGTCAGIPSKQRNVSSLIVQMLQYEDECWMIDCGEGTQQQLLHSSLTLHKISKIFITHLHGDHIYGLPGVLGSRSFQGATSKLQIFGPKGIKEFIEKTLSISNTYVRYPLEIYEIEEGTICKTDTFTFKAIQLEHGIPSFGYRIIEKDIPGELYVDELKKLGILPGPIYKRLKCGETVRLDNGLELTGTDFLGPTKRGKIIAVGGDTRACENQKKLALDADILIHEATFLHKDVQLAFEHYHSTAYEAAKLAVESGAKALFLNHISSRYSKGVEELLEEATAIFTPTFIPNDLETYLVKQNGDVSSL